MTCEQELARTLKKLVLSGSRHGTKLDYSQVDREVVSAAIVQYLEQAQRLGQGFAQQQLGQQSRGLGNALKSVVTTAQNLMSRAINWATSLFSEQVEALGDDASSDDIEAVMESVAEQVADTYATTEIQTVIEETVLDALQASGVAQIEAVNEPDACALCVTNAEAGPIPIGSTFPSGHTNAPFHNRCRCHIQAVGGQS